MVDKNIEGQIDFLGLLTEYTDDQGAIVRVKEPKKTSRSTNREKPAQKEREPEPEQLSIVFEDWDEPEKPVAKEPEPEKLVAEVPEPEKLVAEVPVKKEPAIDLKKAKENVSSEMLFKQCKKCWCFDCKHNSRNEGVPREMCGLTIPCPACDGCVMEEQATVCEIGNAKEGCRFRAIEEGILIQEEA